MVVLKVMYRSFLISLVLSDYYFKVKLFQVDKLRIKGFQIFRGDYLVTCVRKCSLSGGCMFVAYNRSARVCEFYTSIEKMTLKEGSDLLVGAVNTRVRTNFSTRCSRKCHRVTFTFYAGPVTWKQYERGCYSSGQHQGVILSPELQIIAEVLARASGKETVAVGAYLYVFKWVAYLKETSGIQYTHWAPGMPDRTWRGYAALSRKREYKWISISTKSDASMYLCERFGNVYTNNTAWYRVMEHVLNLNLTTPL